MKNTDTIHKFEAAGLGVAPFRYIGAFEDRGPRVREDERGVRVEVGAPGQPMGTCDYCGQGIAICCRIQSADGKIFVVGSDCVAKTGDAGLKKLVQSDARKRAKVREEERIQAFRQRLRNDADFREALAARPHPRGFTDRQTGEPLTLLDQVEWMMANSGHAGELRTVRMVEKLLK